MLDNICPDGPACPDPDCRAQRTARGLPVAPPVVDTRDCFHFTLIANPDPVFPFKCAECGRIYSTELPR